MVCAMYFEYKNIDLFLNLVPWIGGDSAKFIYEKVREIIPDIDYDDYEYTMKKLLKLGFVIESPQKTLSGEKVFELTKKGSEAVNLSLLNNISYWSFISLLLDEKKFGTIQYYFLKHYLTTNLYKHLRSLKYEFVIEYSNNILEKIAYLLELSSRYYSSLRILIARCILYPVRNFVFSKEKHYSQQSPEWSNLIKELMAKKIIKYKAISYNKEIILFREVIMGRKTW